MATQQLETRVRQKRDTSINWTANNPVLLDGEIIIVETSVGDIRKKIGDGIKAYSQLPFDDEAIYAEITKNTDNIEKYRQKLVLDRTTTFTAVTNTDYSWSTAINSLNVTMPTPTDLTIPNIVSFNFLSNGETDVMFSGDVNTPANLTIQPSQMYLLTFRYVGGSWEGSYSSPEEMTPTYGEINDIIAGDYLYAGEGISLSKASNGVTVSSTIISPTITVATNTDTEYTLSITDVDGTVTTPNLKGSNGTDGTNGQDGQQGIQGETGYVFTPSISNDIISWTNDGNLPNPPPVNINPGITQITQTEYDTAYNAGTLPQGLYAIILTTDEV